MTDPIEIDIEFGGGGYGSPRPGVNQVSSYSTPKPFAPATQTIDLKPSPFSPNTYTQITPNTRVGSGKIGAGVGANPLSNSSQAKPYSPSNPSRFGSTQRSNPSRPLGDYSQKPSTDPRKASGVGALAGAVGIGSYAATEALQESDAFNKVKESLDNAREQLRDWLDRPDPKDSPQNKPFNPQPKKEPNSEPDSRPFKDFEDSPFNYNPFKDIKPAPNSYDNQEPGQKQKKKGRYKVEVDTNADRYAINGAGYREGEIIQSVIWRHDLNNVVDPGSPTMYQDGSPPYFGEVMISSASGLVKTPLVAHNIFKHNSIVDIRYIPLENPQPSPEIDYYSKPSPKPTNKPYTSPYSNPSPSNTYEPHTDLNPSTDNYPTTNPSPNPTTNPTTEPTIEPTTNPSPNPTSNPSPDPSPNPTKDPTSEPQSNPSPTNKPSNKPSNKPTSNPGFSPIPDPANNPNFSPVPDPANNPSFSPASDPVNNPTIATGTPSTTGINLPTNITPSIDTSIPPEIEPIVNTPNPPEPATYDPCAANNNECAIDLRNNQNSQDNDSDCCDELKALLQTIISMVQQDINLDTDALASLEKLKELIDVDFEKSYEIEKCEDGSKQKYEIEGKGLQGVLSFLDNVVKANIEHAYKEICEIEPQIGFGDTFLLKLTNAPKLVIGYAYKSQDGKTFERSRNWLTLFHYNNKDIESLPTYNHGRYWAKLLLTDNAPLIVYGQTEVEAIKTINALKSFIDPKYIAANTEPRTGKDHRQLKEGTLYPITAVWYSQGEKELPEWNKQIKKHRQGK